ncbi:MAG: hypothetical protein M1436_09295 [Acidobacteria bacterium]|nr:hypothetical protein [Acidobacteriota bacterium]
MNRLLAFASVCLMASTVGFAQEDAIRHHNVSFGFGPAMPMGTSKDYLKSAPMIGFSYGYRFNRWFQADAGFQMAFGAANEANDLNGVQTDMGAVQGGDHEFMIPLGGRVYLPLPLRRLEASVGGGAAYLHYSETIKGGAGSYDYYGDYYAPTCFSCTSRGGWGGYGLGNVSYFLNEARNAHIGITWQYIAASTDGAAVGNVPAFKTTDHWSNLMFEFGLSF